MVACYQIETIVDVGAHVGGFAMRQRALGFTGRLISFEPSVLSYAKLAQAASDDPRWETSELALGSSDRFADLLVFSGTSQFNSFKLPNSHGHDYSRVLHQHETQRGTRVRRLDTLLPELEVDASTTLLKVDTQGGDVEVLDGAGTLASDFPGVLMELAVEPIYEGAPRIEEGVSFMRDLGFELTGAFPVHRYGDGVRVIEFDCTFCNVR